MDYLPGRRISVIKNKYSSLNDILRLYKEITLLHQTLLFPYNSMGFSGDAVSHIPGKNNVLKISLFICNSFEATIMNLQ